MKNIALSFDGTSCYRAWIKDAGVHECMVTAETDVMSLLKHVRMFESIRMIRTICAHLNSEGLEYKSIYVLESLKDFKVSIFVLTEDNNGMVIWDDPEYEEYQIKPCVLRGRSKIHGSIIWDVRDKLSMVHEELLEMTECTN